MFWMFSGVPTKIGLRVPTETPAGTNSRVHEEILSGISS